MSKASHVIAAAFSVLVGDTKQPNNHVTHRYTYSLHAYHLPPETERAASLGAVLQQEVERVEYRGRSQRRPYTPTSTTGATGSLSRD